MTRIAKQEDLPRVGMTRIGKQEVMARVGRTRIVMHGRLPRGMSALDRELAIVLVFANMVFQDDVMTEGASNSRPPLLKGHNYGFWKLRMKAYIRSIDERAWMTVEEGYLVPNNIEDGVTVSKPRSEWSTNEFELAKWHHWAVNAIFGGVDSRQFSYIQNLETAKEAWEALQVTNEVTKAVKKSRLQLLTSQFEVLQMGEKDKFVDFQDKLLDIANQCQALGTPISGERLNWKILRSLPKRFKAKVTAIEESKDVDVMSLDELLGSLQTFEAYMKPKAKNKGLGFSFQGCQGS
ncbi:hypothetical protein Q3G72_017324 [Acer saccharum]|nr:hypothetical protein Q3G72_017324 [Acer saccharum]